MDPIACPRDPTATSTVKIMESEERLVGTGEQVLQ